MLLNLSKLIIKGETKMKYKYKRGATLICDSGEILKIMRRLNQESLNAGEPVYLVKYQGKLQTLSESEILNLHVNK